MDIKELVLYAECPMKYELNKECQMPSQEYSNIEDKYITEIKKVISFFFNMVYGEDRVSLPLLKKEWSKLWISRRKKNELLLPITNPVIGWNRKKEGEGLDAIITLYNKFYDEIFDVIAVNTDFMVSLNRGSILTGVWPLIIVRNEKVEIIDFRLSTEKFNINNDIKLTAMSMAYRKWFNDEEDKLSIYLIDKGKIMSTTRNEKDFEILHDNYMNIKKHIKGQNPYRVLNNNCEKCPYSKICRGELNA